MGNSSLVAEVKKIPELSKPWMKVKEHKKTPLLVTSLKVPKPKTVLESREPSLEGKNTKRKET